jgi:hypothetical protein
VRIEGEGREATPETGVELKTEAEGAAEGEGEAKVRLAGTSISQAPVPSTYLTDSKGQACPSVQVKKKLTIDPKGLHLAETLDHPIAGLTKTPLRTQDRLDPVSRLKQS